MSGVEFSAVTFRYPGVSVDAIRELKVQWRPGEITWLYGPVGAGCTTSLLLAAGLAPRHTGGTLYGTVTTLGTNAGLPENRAALAGRIGYVHAVPLRQLSGIASTVWEEAAFAPANLGWPIDRIRRAVDASLERMGVAHLAGRAPDTLSGGELQRVVLASILALKPDVWLLDEPASALDSSGSHELMRLLREEADGGCTVVIASEDANALAEVADRLLVLGAGQIRLDGAPRELLAGESIWENGPGSTSIAELARAAAVHTASPKLTPPYPITVAEGVARWA